ncbi:aminotransferase [Saltatorellus ferox]|uniref:kynureninase/PvdN C-terminal domain-containing protein n=1 Tax=Saltatorellus ferox TaxID=2528018 RepID=UPI003AF40733
MTILDATPLFSRALQSEPERLHFTAHSHHLWPDATRAAQERAWQDAAELADEKWARIFGEVYPTTQRHIARVLNVPDPGQIAFSANTHDLLVRLMSGLEGWDASGGGGKPLRVLSTDSEFHSFSRQMRRFRESGRVHWDTVAAEPFETFPERFREAAQAASYDLVFSSHVFFSSGYVFDEVFEILGDLPEKTTCVVDGYHGFFAVDTNFGPYAERLYYMSGGYKYAMSGEGVCFLVAPPGRELRPEITGWFAGFDSLAEAQEERVGYDGGGNRFMGATFEPTPMYRFNAVCETLLEAGFDVASVHAHCEALQDRFLDAVAAGDAGDLRIDQLMPARETGESRRRRGRFLTFRRADAQERQQALLAKRVITDARGDRLRFGFGLYHTAADVDRLTERLRGYPLG